MSDRPIHVRLCILVYQAAPGPLLVQVEGVARQVQGAEVCAAVSQGDGGGVGWEVMVL